MKKKTKVNKKRLDSLLLILLLTAVLMIMSTYAWFTANRTVTIDTFDVRIDTTSGLQISATAEPDSWGTSLRLNDLIDATTNSGYGIVNQLPSTMEPMSTVPKNNGGKLNMYLGTTVQNEERNGFYLSTKQEYDKSYSAVADANNGHYIAFDIFLKSGSQEDNLYMYGSVIETDEDGNALALEKEKGIANSARVAILRSPNTVNSEDGATLRTQLQPTDSKVLLWEPNADTHTEKGAKNANELKWYGDLKVENGTGKEALDYYDGVKDVISEEKKLLLSDATSTTNGSYFEKVTPTWQTSRTQNGKVNLVMPSNSASGKALEYGVVRYRIYMWMEGQDVDCESSAADSYAQFTINFTLDKIKNTSGDDAETIEAR